MAQIKRHASAQWHGSGKEGTGSLTTQSGTLKDTPYGFNARFGDGKGTNPEELIAAAHAGCFSMALSAQLNSAGLSPERIDTTATVTLEKQDAGFAITRVHLVCRAKVPDVDAQKFQQVAEAAKNGCPVSKLLNAKISLEARLESQVAAD